MNPPDGESVTFSNGSMSCTGTLSSGTATCAFAATLGSDTVSASYAGDSKYGSSTGSTSITVNPISTTTSMSVTTSGPYTYGESVTYSATVTGSDGSSPPGGETVTFSNGSKSCAGTLSSGTATCAFTATVGTDTVSASYGGDSKYGSSEGSTSITVGEATTTTSVSVTTSGPYTYGESVTYSATVVAPDGLSPPDGETVSFNNGVTSCTGHLSGGTASCPFIATVGTDTVSASYGGDSNYGSSSGSTSITVGEATTTTKVSETPSGPYTYGESLTYQVTVAAPSTGTYQGSPSGTVNVAVDGSTLCTATLAVVAATNTSTASCSSSNAPAGTDAVSASYGGDSNFASSSSAANSIDVSKANTKTTVSISQSSVPYGNFVTYDVVVQPQPPVNPTDAANFPTGTVVVSVGGSQVCAPSLDSNYTATCDVAVTAPLGTDTVSASYGGDGNFNISAGSTSVTVTVAQQSITFVTPSSASVGGSATLSATASSGLPVVFTVDHASGTEVCGLSGSNGATVRFFSEGTCIIDANQAGNADYFAAPQVYQEISVGVPAVGAAEGERLRQPSCCLTLLRRRDFRLPTSARRSLGRSKPARRRPSSNRSTARRSR